MTNWSDQEVDIERIDCTNRSFAITTAGSIEALCSHIGRFGLLAPPILRHQNQSYQVVAGFHRIDACRTLGWKRLWARLIDASDAQCAEIAVADNTGQRTLNWIETARAYALLRPYCPDETALLDCARALGLAAGPDILRKTTALLALPEPLQRWVEDDVLPIPMALELGKLEQPEDAVCLGELFRKLNLGLNRQRELLAFVSDIARRDHLPIRQLLQAPQIVGILEDPKADPPAKANRLRTLLRNLRYPKITAFEAQYQRDIRELHLPKGVELVAPDHFEGSTWRLAIHFTNPEELGQQLKTVQGLDKHPVLLNWLR